MIAIPIESAKPTMMSSKLFGNAPMFAVYEPEEEQFFVIQNEGEGDGLKTASFLKKKGITSVVYTYLGEGLYKALNNDGIEVYYLGNESLPITGIIDTLDEGGFVKVEPANAKTYLNPGTDTGDCRCGCDHG